MNYELSKKLKDKGFPEPVHCDCNYSQLNGGYYAPSLSELIEACGEKFESIERYMPEEKMPWRAFMSDDAFEEYSKEYPCIKECCGYEIGDTPEEAVARLWLSLQEK
jgi:hypothetical protein